MESSPFKSVGSDHFPVPPSLMYLNLPGFKRLARSATAGRQI